MGVKRKVWAHPNGLGKRHADYAREGNRRQGPHGKARKRCDLNARYNAILKDADDYWDNLMREPICEKTN